MNVFLRFLAVTLAPLVCLIPALYADDLVVSRHSTLVDDIAGDLHVTQGAAVTAVNIHVQGNIHVESGAKFYGKGIQVEGGLSAHRAGNITIQKSGVQFSSIGGDVQISECLGTIRLFNIALGGHVLLENNAAVDIVLRGNTVAGDVQLFDNFSNNNMLLRNNTIAGNIQKLGNTPEVVETGNVVAGPPAIGSVIEVVASGLAGNETIQLSIDQVPMRQWQATVVDRAWRYCAPEIVSPDRVRVAYVSNPATAENVPQGLRVDVILIDGLAHETEADSVYATGVDPPGFHQIEWLTADGYFQYGLTRLEDDLIVFALNAVLPDGWASTIAPAGNDVRLRTYNPAGAAAFSARFGAAGVIASFQDSSNGKELLAPSYQGEVTDRVMQWTVWEQGQSAVYDAPSLPYWEDRFNIAQAGTYHNVLHPAIAVEWFPDRAQWDVWSRSDRLWKSELEPNLTGSIDSLTRTTLLDGGAILVRRVVRIGEIRRLGVPVTLGNPLLESWNPLSDKVFNSFALSLDALGKPDEFYKDSINIPHYPGWPIADTRGWALAYNRFQLASGPTMAVVFGREMGEVHRGDGSIVDPQRFVLNSMDFSGGFCVLPGLWTKGIPEGTIVDVFTIIVPGRGINVSTAATLDALSERLPPPRVYHPGARLPGELSVIADRLRDGVLQPQFRTEQLGTLW